MEKYKKGFKRKENEVPEEKAKTGGSKFHFSNVQVIPGPVIDDPVSPFYTAGKSDADGEENNAAVQAEEITSPENTVSENNAEPENRSEAADSEGEAIVAAEEAAAEDSDAEIEPAQEIESTAEIETVVETEPSEEITFEDEKTEPADEIRTETEAESTAEPETVNEKESEAENNNETAFAVPESEVKAAVVTEPVIKNDGIAEEENGAPTICIIDETSTSVTIEEGPDISVNEILPTDGKKAKKAKEPLKLKPIQIILMAVVGLVALWFVIFTVDHTLAANGISPVFCKKEVEYDDGSVSYKGLGYKVQFKFDAQGNLTQMVLPSWKDGPNDVSE